MPRLQLLGDLLDRVSVLLRSEAVDLLGDLDTGPEQCGGVLPFLGPGEVPEPGLALLVEVSGQVLTDLQGESNRRVVLSFWLNPLDVGKIKRQKLGKVNLS